MAVTNYLQKCDYRIGGLKPYIYLIHKDALQLNIKAKGVEVRFKKTKEGDVYKVNGALCVFSQEETYKSKYRFNSNLEFTVNEQYKEPFLYGLQTLRTNQYYIIITDKKGIQYLINPELYTKMTYEYTFTDTEGDVDSCLIMWNNLSNFPLLIFEENIEETATLLFEECPYNLGHIFSFHMASFKDLNVKDDGVKVDEMYVDDYTQLKTIEFLKNSVTVTEEYDGVKFRLQVRFSIPMDDNQFEWVYDLLEFKDNVYKAIARTTNDNYLILGNEKGLFPSYTIETSEDDGTPNMFNVTLTQLSQYPILYTNDITQYRWIDDGEMCFGFEKYKMLTKEYSKDWGETWIDAEEKKKGELIDGDSEDCKEYQWVDDGTYCYTASIEYIDYRETTSYVCENGNKYKKLQKYISTDNGKTYKAQDEYIKGELIEENADECARVAIRWVDDNGYMCYPVNEDLTRWNVTRDTCIGVDLYGIETEEVTNNGVIYYPTYNEQIGGIIKENCCKCGYRTYEYKFDADVCSSAITESNPTILDKDAYFEIIKDEGVVNGWTRSGNTFTSQSGLTNNVSVHRIHFKTNRDTIKFTIDQSSEKNYDYLIIGKLNSGVTSGTSSTNNYCNFKTLGIGTTTTSMTVPINEDCSVELMYLKDGSSNKGRDNVIVTIGLEDNLTLQPNSMYERHYKWETCEDEYDSFNRNTGEVVYYIKELNSCDCDFVGYDYMWDGKETICGSVLGGSYDSTSEYEVWREYEKCEGIPTGNIDYRNPKKSFKCNWIAYQWREEEITCGGELPENTTEVNEAPELNTDFE